MRRRLFTILPAASLALCVAACVLWVRSHRVEGKPATMAATRPASSDRISGRVRFRGAPPERRPVPGLDKDAPCAKLNPGGLLEEAVVVNPTATLRTAVVYLKGAPAIPADPRAEPLLFRSTRCRYEPHVLAAQVGRR